MLKKDQKLVSMLRFGTLMQENFQTRQPIQLPELPSTMRVRVLLGAAKVGLIIGVVLAVVSR